MRADGDFKLYWDARKSSPSNIRSEERPHGSSFLPGKSDEKAFTRLILERTSDLVAVTTLSVSPRYVYLSPSHKRILGYDASDLLNKSPFDLIHPDDVPRLFPLLEKYVTSLSLKNALPGDLKLPTERLLYRITDKSGNWHSLETTGDLLADGLILFISKDVTERVKAENDLLESREVLQTNVEEQTKELTLANEALRKEIMERQQKEEELRDSERKYKNILETIEDGYYEVDLSGNMTFFNNALCEMTGYPPEELQGMNNRAYTDPEMANRMFEIFNRVYRTGEPSRIDDYVVIKKDGTKCTVQLSTSLITNPSGEAVGFRGIARDITKRRLIEKALEESEEKYRTILQSIEDGYYEVDIRGNFVFFNEALPRILGYDSKELMGMNNRTYMTEETAKEVYRVSNQVFRTGLPAKTFDWTVIRKNGEKRYLETSISLLRGSRGEAMGFRGVARDVTERRLARMALEESEQKYRTILQSIEDGYYEVDPSGNMVFFNHSMCRIVGYGPDELQGMNNRKYMTEETAKLVYQTFNQVYRTGDAAKAIGWELVRKDGEKRYVETSVSLVRGRKGDPVGFRGIARDITERMSLEKARERMISHIAHELGTPVSIVQASLLQIANALDKMDFDQIRRSVERARRHIDRLKDLQNKVHDIVNGRPAQEKERILYFIEAALNQVEELAKEPLEPGAEAIRKSVAERLDALYSMERAGHEVIPLGAFLDEVCSDALQSMKNRQIEIIRSFNNRISIEMEKKALRAICAGFLRNAIENTPDEGRIEIRMKQTDKSVRVEFDDSGVGITPQNQKLIFGGFFHTQDTSLYASKKPYLFNAGGSGSDLLRAKVLSERLNFSLDFASIRCKYLPSDKDQCPGKISLCSYAKGREDCLSSGGSVFSLVLPLNMARQA